MTVRASRIGIDLAIEFVGVDLVECGEGVGDFTCRPIGGAVVADSNLSRQSNLRPSYRPYGQGDHKRMGAKDRAEAMFMADYGRA